MGVLVGVCVGVPVDVGVLVTVGVLVFVGVLVTVGVLVFVGVLVTVAVVVGVFVGVFVAVAVGVTVVEKWRTMIVFVKVLTGRLGLSYVDVTWTVTSPGWSVVGTRI